MGIFFGCEDSVNQDSLTYHGKEVLESTPSFVLPGGRVMYKGSGPNVAIETNPPYGTVYGLITDTANVYLAQGGELLPDSTWTDQIYQNTYGTTLYSNSAVTFLSPATVTITNATNCMYLDVNDNWVPVTGDITVTAKAISAGLNGSCYFETDSKVLMGHGGQNG